MFNRLPRLIFVMLVLTTGVLHAQSPSPKPIEPKKPLLNISFERQAIKENDAIQVRVWLTNEWDQSLSAVTLNVDSPATLKWTETTCAKRATDWNSVTSVSQFQFGAVGPNEVKSKSLCVQSGSSIDVGEFNILFTADYSWNNNGVTAHSLVTTEKQLKANLFGSDTVAGVPIALASFIVPGLFFWLVLGWLKSPWNIGGSPLGDKLIYSILISLLLLWIVNWFGPDQNAGISFSKLTFYAGTGVAAGIVVSIVSHLYKSYKDRDLANELRLKKEREIKLGDGPEVLLGKLLELYPDEKNPRATLRTPDGKVYGGSLATETEEVVGIVGWFQIDAAKITHQDKATILAELQAATRSIDRFNIAKKYGLRLEGRNPITVGGNDTVELAFTNPSKDAEAQTLRGQGTDEPLVVV